MSNQFPTLNQINSKTPLHLNTRTKNNQTATYTYDTQGNLKEVKLPTKTINYIHNPNNQIIAKKINNEIVEKYLWHNLKLLAIYDKNDNLKTRYFYADNRVPYKMIKNNKTYYLYYNQINSLKLIVDTKNNIIKKLSYDTYGNIIKDTNKDFNIHINYAGGFYDKDTKLIRFGKRDYFPEQRRWTAIDPIGFDGGDLNLYGYVLSDPISGVDPSGLVDMNLFDESDLIYTSAFWHGLFSSNYTVGGHSYRGGIKFKNQNIIINAKKLASMIKHDPKYKQQDIILYVCYVGRGGNKSFAQQLSNILNVKVTAPNGEYLYALVFGIGSVEAGAKMITFSPQGK